VVNLLAWLVKPQQVMLQMHVAEVSRDALRELGFSIRALGSTIQGQLPEPRSSRPGAPRRCHPAGVLDRWWASSRPTSSSPRRAAAAVSRRTLRNYAGLIRALADRNLLRTLAKPNLVTQSGKEAKFLSGGEFPYPVSQSDNTIGIEFKEFGIGLVFLPVVVDGETINLKIRPEVSSLDFSQGLRSAGFNIPVVRKNEAATTINLKDGESFAIAGLINNEVRQRVGKIPLLGDIPIIGAIFRSTAFQNNETELLFIVTVKLVKPDAPGSGPDPRRLMEVRPEETEEFTLVPGIPGVGEVVTRPFGQSNMPAR
jgi:pilus assembly protein CpaC